jgi:hypothetical protein
MISQHRDTPTLSSYNTADSLAPLPAGLTAALCQIFMGIRCLKITGRSIVLSVVIAAGILASLAGAVWLTVANGE